MSGPAGELPKGSRLQHWLGQNTDIRILPLVFLLVVLLMSAITGGEFLAAPNIRAIAFQLPELGLLSFAMMVAMLTGGINLSIVSSANFTGVLMALLLSRFAEASGSLAVLAVGAIIAAGLLFSVFLGLLNGILIAWVGVSPVLTTLGTMIFYEGLTLAITRGYVISGFPEALLFIGNGSLWGVPLPFIIFVIVSVAMSLLVRRRPLGRYFQMIGSNIRATEYSCINVKMVLLKAYALSGFLAGLAGVVMIARFNSANARYGVSYMLLSVLIAVLGGTNPEGGSGKVLGIVLALFTLQSLTSGLNLLEISSFATVALWGILLALVIVYRHYALQKRNTSLARLSQRD